MTELLDKIAPLLTEKSWLTPLSALLAGVVTSFMPCSLSSIPLVIGYVGGTGQNDSKRAFKLSLIYVAGTAVTFTALGIIAALAGRLMELPAPGGISYWVFSWCLWLYRHGRYFNLFRKAIFYPKVQKKAA